MDEAPLLYVSHHVCYSLTIIMNMIVVTVFWGMLWRIHIEQECPKEAAGDKRLLELFVMNAYCNHTIPGICAGILMTTTDSVLLLSDLRFILLVVIAYVSFNWYQVRIKGNDPTYIFLTYESSKSWAILFGIIFTAAGMFAIFTAFDQTMKGRRMPESDWLLA